MTPLGQLLIDEGLVEVAYVKASPKSKSKKTKSKGILDSELAMMLDDLKTLSGVFGNKDLADFLGKWGLTNRQTPSRLKKLADQGLLERYDTKPLTYSVK